MLKVSTRTVSLQAYAGTGGDPQLPISVTNIVIAARTRVWVGDESGPEVLTRRCRCMGQSQNRHSSMGLALTRSAQKINHVARTYI